MIDLHSHLAYGFDDGAADREVCCRMLEAYAAGGVAAVCATGHSAAAEGSRYEDAFAATAELAAGFGVKVLPGLEYALTDLLAEQKYPLGDGGCLLLDTALFPVDTALVNKLMPLSGQGFSILWAHPERLHPNSILRTAAQYDLLRGSACQVNAGSFLGRYGREVADAAWKLLQAGRCAVIASDAHDAAGVEMFLRAKRKLDEFYPPELTDMWFARNPARLLAGKAPERPTPPPLSWSKRWKLRLGR
ncbi:MAG: hypothetical protein MR051_03335 [Lentisphaeria bacterium]|nr:hypothetical protein [Lentisphaeria bacterium]